MHNLAQAHGQPGWLAWVDAVVLELMSIATGLEIRRRHRAGHPARFVPAVLVAAALSLATQVVEAERSAVGWLVAAPPALGLLACVKTVLSRQMIRTEPTSPTHLVPVPAAPVAVPVSIPAAVPDGPIVAWTEQPLFPMIVQDAQDDTDLTTDLLAPTRRVATAHRASTGRDITCDQLRTALCVHRYRHRSWGQSLGSPIASGGHTKRRG